MIVQNISTNGCPQTIVIGRRGTYDTMQIAFDLSYLIESYGSGTAVLAVKRSQDESAYPAVVTQEDSTLLWTVNETDTAYVGSGECQLMWYVEGGLAKTIIYPMVVMRDILSTAEEPPDGYENWIEHLTGLGAETQQNAQAAAQSASEAEQAKDDAVAAKEAAEEAAETAQEAVTHAPIIQNGYWYIWNDGQYVDTGIRAEGQKGDKGDAGEKGDTGNGIESITKTGTSGLVDTYTVTYTDGTTTTFTVTNGAKGDKGDTGATGNGIQSITKTGTSGNVDTYTITYTNGQTTTFTVTNGAVSSVNGKTGAVNLASGDIAYDESATYQAGSVGAELQNQTRQLSDKQNAPSTAGTPGQVLGLDSNLNPAWIDQAGLNVTQKLAFLNCFEHVAWTDASGATYYDELYSVLINPEMIASISASYENEDAVYPSTPLDDLRQYITVTATYSDSSTKTVSAYTISGTLTVGSSVLTIGYLGKTATITVTVTEERKSDMDEWSDGVPYTDLEIVQNSYYNANGTPTNYNGWDRTEKIYCHGASTIEFIRNNTSTSGSDTFSFWYDENKAKVGSSFRFMPAGAITNTVEVPAEAYYFAISGSRSAVNEVIDSITPYA